MQTLMFGYDLALQMETFVKAKMPTFELKIRMDGSPYRKRAWGGPAGISIPTFRVNQPWTYVCEYESLRNDSDIGDLYCSGDSKISMAGVLAHEIAHAAVNTNYNKRMGHGKEWQDFYRELRKEFVNPLMIKDNSNKDLRWQLYCMEWYRYLQQPLQNPD